MTHFIGCIVYISTITAFLMSKKDLNTVRAVNVLGRLHTDSASKKSSIIHTNIKKEYNYFNVAAFQIIK